MRYLLVTGGVISGLGKGITASSLGVLLQCHGCRVTAIKIDPYLNLDSGTMSPFEHGECFVLKDGCEVDLDLGNYERFLGVELTRDHNITTGKVYSRVLEAERRGDYLGATVQVVPHITDTVIEWISRIGQSSGCDVCIIELGGTIGDIESLHFLEALRQMKFNSSNIFCHVHVSYLLSLKSTGELKTKPAQRSVTDVRTYGLNPDFLCLRCESSLSTDILKKIETMCGVPISNILENVDVSNIYQVSTRFAPVVDGLWNSLGLEGRAEPTARWETWKGLALEFDKPYPTVNVCIVGKYSGLNKVSVALKDSYLSLTHAIRHAAVSLKRTANIIFVESTDLERGQSNQQLENCDAIIIPGGFGQRGIEGMIYAANYGRTNKIPTLGICLGMQVMVIEWARNVLGFEEANSTEFSQSTRHPLLIIMDDSQSKMGGTMRLGLQQVKLLSDSKVYQAYGNKAFVEERHRHRYEVNPNYHKYFDKAFLFTGFDLSGSKVEIVELDGDQFYLGCQFHPEYQTYPDRPHPLFVKLLSHTLLSNPPIPDI